MYGKDLTDSGIQSGKIARVLGGNKPEGLIYELFLDGKGEKISKSKGNGLSIEQWLQYGSEESLGYYIFANPKSAKQLHAGVIPKAIDDYWQFRAALPGQDIDKQLGNPVWHLLRTGHHHDGAEAPGAGDTLPVPFSLLLNLVGVLGAGATREAVWSYLGNYVAGADPAAHPALDALVMKALAYNRDFVASTLVKRAPADGEAAALWALDAALAEAPADISAELMDLEAIALEKGAAFGSGSSGSLFGATGSANFLSRLTAVLATVFFVCTLALAFFANSRTEGRTPASVMDAVAPPATAPATPAGAVPAAAPVPAPAAGNDAPQKSGGAGDIPK
jgi:lysyl-tRNA synthetase class 1